MTDNVSTPDVGDVGASVEIRPDGSHLEHAAELEELGYGALWISGGQIDRLERISDLVRATRRIPVVSSIIPTGSFSPLDVLDLYRELEAAHPGRFLVGLGPPQNRPRPAAELGALLDHLDAARPPLPAEHRILGALGPQRLALARERFAGAVPLLVTPEYTAGARDVLGPDRLLVVEQPFVLDDDPRRARDTARGLLGFLLQVTGYPDNFRRMGFSDADVDGLSDRLVDGVVAHGGPADIAERVAAHHAAGADHVAVGAIGGGTVDGVEAARLLAAPLLTPAV